MAYYNVCPECGCNLDPNEKCECMDEKKRAERKKLDFFRKKLNTETRTGQIVFDFSSWDEHEKSVNF